MTLTAVVLGGLSAFLGVVASALVPRLSGGPVIVLVGTAFFLLSLFLGTRRGIVRRVLLRMRTKRRVGRLDLLRAFYEALEPATAGDETIKLTGCPVAFEQLALPRRWPYGKLLAAAVLLAGVGLGLALQTDNPATVPAAPNPPPGPPTLRLASIPLTAAEPVEPSWPATLANYAPSNRDGIRWFDNLDEAREIATYLDLPILVFMDYRHGSMQCPICASYDHGAFRDSDVSKQASKFVLVRLNFATTPPPLGQIELRVWPVFHVLGSKGDRLMTFGGPGNGRGLASLFRRGPGGAGPPRPRALLRRGGGGGVPDQRQDGRLSGGLRLLLPIRPLPQPYRGAPVPAGEAGARLGQKLGGAGRDAVLHRRRRARAGPGAPGPGARSHRRHPA